MASDKTLGARVKARREERGLSPAALADLAKISRSYLSQLEAGDIDNPSAAVLFRIAKNLGTSVAHLLGEVPEQVDDGGDEEPLDPILLQFAREDGLSDDDITMLAGIKRRGARPKSVADWRFIYGAITRTIRTDQNGGAEE